MITQNPEMTRRSPRRSLSPEGSRDHIVRAVPMFPSIPDKRKRRIRRSSSISAGKLDILRTPVIWFLLIWVILFILGYFVVCQWSTDKSAHNIRGVVAHSNFVNSSNDLSSLSLQPLTSHNKEAIPRSTSDDESEEELPLIHIIHTRFMQHQPHLVALGLARLKLFEAFYLKSLQEQTSNDFFCVIRVDPDLDPILRQPLLELLENSNLQYLLIASNEEPHSQYWDILKRQSDDNVISGDFLQIQKSFHQSKYVLESRLDMDDGLNTHFVDHIQELARLHFDNYDDDTLSSTSASWKIWCASTHFEWNYISHKALRENKIQESIIDDPGSLTVIRTDGCITAGLTVAYVAPNANASSDDSNFPSTGKHDKIARNYAKCNTKTTNGRDSACFDFVDIVPTAIRARTPTSAGMLHVLWPNTSGIRDASYRKYLKYALGQEGQQEKLWIGAAGLFGFSQELAEKVKNYLASNMQVIVQDNLHGQCTSGHSCKKTTSVVLQLILQGYTDS